MSIAFYLCLFVAIWFTFINLFKGIRGQPIIGRNPYSVGTLENRNWLFGWELAYERAERGDLSKGP